MKIMFAVATYWPAQDGVSQVTQYLASGLAARKHEVFVLTGTGNGGLEPLPKKEVYRGVQIERMNVFVRWPLLLRGRDRESSPKTYYERIMAFQPDVLIVVCSQTWTLDWIMPYMDKIKCKKVFYSHGYSALKDHYEIREQLSKRNVLGAWIEFRKKRYYEKLHKVIRKFDFAIYLFRENNSAVYAEQYKLTNGKVLSNAIDDRFFDKDMQHTYTDLKSGKTMQYLYVANYNENKNQEMLVKAFCKANIENAELVFVGSSDTEYLKQIREIGADLLRNDEKKSIKYKVNITREEVYNLYKASDVFVCVSKSETSSLVLFEAGATGMPIISTDVGLAQTIDGIRLVYNEADLIEALELMYHNPKMQKECGTKIQAYVDSAQYRISDKVDWLERELTQIVKQKG